jgi:AraC-like DNA-binding protein
MTIAPTIDLQLHRFRLLAYSFEDINDKQAPLAFDTITFVFNLGAPLTLLLDGHDAVTIESRHMLILQAPGVDGKALFEKNIYYQLIMFYATPSFFRCEASYFLWQWKDIIESRLFALTHSKAVTKDMVETLRQILSMPVGGLLSITIIKLLRQVLRLYALDERNDNKSKNKTVNNKVSSVQRIEKAKQLLADTDLPVIDVAEQCGFLGYPAFSVAFKKSVGKSAVEYRKFLKNTAISGK